MDGFSLVHHHEALEIDSSPASSKALDVAGVLEAEEQDCPENNPII